MNKRDILKLFEELLKLKDDFIQYREGVIMVIDCIFSYYIELLKNNLYEAYWSEEMDFQEDDEEKVEYDYNWLYNYKNIFWKESDDTREKNYSILSRAKMLEGTKKKKKFRNPFGWEYKFDKFKVILPNNSYGPYHIMFLTDINFINLFSKWSKDSGSMYYDNALKYGYKLQRYQSSNKYNENKDGKFIGLLYEKMLGVNLVNLIANYLSYIFENLRPCKEGDGYYCYPEWRKEEKVQHRNKMEKRIIVLLGSILDNMRELGTLTKLMFVNSALHMVCLEAEDYAEDVFNILHMNDYESVYDWTKSYHTCIYNSISKIFCDIKELQVMQENVKKTCGKFDIDIGFIESMLDNNVFIKVCHKILSHSEFESKIGLAQININKPIPPIMIEPPKERKYRNYAVELFNINNKQ